MVQCKHHVCDEECSKFNSLLQKNMYSLRSRVQCSNNVYVSVIYESDIKYKSALFKRIEILLSNNIVVYLCRGPTARFFRVGRLFGADFPKIGQCEHKNR